MKKKVVLIVLVLMFFGITAAFAQNVLAGTTWIVPNVRDGLNFVFTFNRDGSANFIENERLDAGQYGKLGEIMGGMYSFMVQTVDGDSMPYFSEPINNTLEIFGETFILKTGDASNNLAGTVWWVDRVDQGYTLTFTDNIYIFEHFYNNRGTYTVQNNRVSVNFPDAFSNDSVIIDGNSMKMGQFTLLKQ